MGKVAVGARDRIDFAGVNDRADLRRLVVSELGEPDRGRKWRCPFHDDRNPSLGITPDGKRYKCHSCGATGTALDWVMQRSGVDVVEAARRLDPSIPAPARREGRAVAPPKVAPILRTSKPKRALDEPWRDPTWQVEAEGLVRRAEDRLWSPAGLPALEWLRGRGLEDHTIRRFRLGFVADEDRSIKLEAIANDDGPRSIWAPRGITFPWVAPGGWYPADSEPVDDEGRPVPRWVGVNVRRLMPDVCAPWPGKDKCLAILGSRRGFAYPHDDPTPGVPALIVEGETDALTGFQEVGHLVEVVHVGGSGQTPRPEVLDALAESSAWLIATDHDLAGDEAAVKWLARCPGKARRVHLPFGKDINAFHTKGGDLRDWLAGELARLGLV